MKKRSLWLLVAALFMVFSANLFADIAVKQLSDKEVEVTFSFRGPDSKEVFIAGDLNGWSTSADPMTKGADGIWTITKKFAMTDAITWKYVADGAWITDLKAPVFVDDGFGGKNSKLVIAEYLASKTGAAPAVAAGPKLTPIGFGTWSILRAGAGFLTKDVAAGTVDGYDFDNVYVEAKSYWKLGGDILPGISTAMELQVLQYKMPLYQANTLSTGIPFTSWADGLQSMVDAVFHPFDAFNGNASPLLGHFKATLTTPYVKFFTGYHYSKGTNHSFSWDVSKAADNDAGAGFLEISLGEKLKAVSDTIALDGMVAPNKRAGTDGVYSWLNATIDGNYVVDLAFNTKTTNANAFYYFEDNQNMVTLGASAKFGTADVKASALVNFGSTANVANTFDIDSTAFALAANYKSDMFNLGLAAKLGGDNAYTVFGDDGSLKKGNLWAQLMPEIMVEPIDLVLQSEYTTTDEMNSFGTGSLFFKPQLTAKLKDFIGIDLTVALIGSMNVYLDPAATDAFMYNEGDLKVTLKKVVDFLPNIEVYFANQYAKGSVMKDSVLFNLGLKDNMGVTAGFIARTNLKAAADPTLCAFGGNLGYSWVLPIANKPTFYANTTYNFDPYDDGQPGFDMGDDHMFRADNTDNGVKVANYRVGLIWSF